MGVVTRRAFMLIVDPATSNYRRATVETRVESYIYYICWRFPVVNRGSFQISCPFLSKRSKGKAKTMLRRCGRNASVLATQSILGLRWKVSRRNETSQAFAFGTTDFRTCTRFATIFRVATVFTFPRVENNGTKQRANGLHASFPRTLSCE